MTEIDAAIVRCPVGHGLFIISGGPASRNCPGCGAYLVAVHDDAPLGGSGIVAVPFSLDRASEPMSGHRESLQLAPKAAVARSA